MPLREHIHFCLNVLKAGFTHAEGILLCNLTDVEIIPLSQSKQMDCLFCFFKLYQAKVKTCQLKVPGVAFFQQEKESLINSCPKSNLSSKKYKLGFLFKFNLVSALRAVLCFDI